MTVLKTGYRAQTLVLTTIHETFSLGSQNQSIRQHITAANIVHRMFLEEISVRFNFSPGLLIGEVEVFNDHLKNCRIQK